MGTKATMRTKNQILSIGHSTLDTAAFVGRLKSAGVTGIADVRSSPFSRKFPQYNRNRLKADLARDGIVYSFLGSELGGRPEQPSYYTDGIADYEKMSTDANFKVGLTRVEEGSRKYRIALMCSERNPLDCHRCLLVGRALVERGLDISHILSCEEIISQAQIEERLLAMVGKHDDDMFASANERLSDAYRQRARKVAFAKAQPALAPMVVE